MEIKDLELLDKAPPRQVKEAFENVIGAQAGKDELINHAEGEYNVTISRAQAEADNILAQARAYQKTVVAAAQSDTDYFEKVLSGIEQAVDSQVPEGTADYEKKYRQKYAELMEIYIDQFYQEMLREVIEKAEEVFVAFPTEEMRIYINRDTKIKPPAATDQRNIKEEE